MTIDDVRKRFEETEQLKQFLPMLDEYIFQQARIDWMCEASILAVYRYCAETDE